MRKLRLNNFTLFFLSMTRAIITGVAGFIGSHLSEELLKRGYTVIGIDNFDPWYDPDTKSSNLEPSLSNSSFELLKEDIRTFDFSSLLQEEDTVFHLAARPGVQDSWGNGFLDNVEINIYGTQRIFEAALEKGVKRVAFASSSSIYGSTATELGRKVQPISPYGVSKAACEQLASVYFERGLSLVPLRYFTVYGPRQRPDMAMNRLFRASVPGSYRFPLRGDGTQSREFTYVDDVVHATILAGFEGKIANLEPLDIGGGVSASINDVIQMIEKITGETTRIDFFSPPPGDPKVTIASTETVERLLGWKASTSLIDGLEQQYLSLTKTFVPSV